MHFDNWMQSSFAQIIYLNTKIKCWWIFPCTQKQISIRILFKCIYYTTILLIIDPDIVNMIIIVSSVH